MLAWIFAIVNSLLVVGGTVASVMFLRKKFAPMDTTKLEQVQAEIQTIDQRIEKALKTDGDIASKPQYDAILAQTQEVVSELQQQQSLLKEIESKLANAQKDVEVKETHQQEVKSAKAEDEAKLQALLAAFEDTSSESIALEQRLAQSMKELDALLNEVNLDPTLKIILQELSNSLTAAGNRLRELITDYRAVNERLEMIKQQHIDLEDEYTKLVEQQLGG